ncbi:MAG: ABC transporter, partial [Candidatus Shapirobacteria bacterium]|nr:ABC transporter [Candidatus Shapirobacteria bacterium]
KYAEHKLISVVLNEKVELKKLKEIGEIKEFVYPHVNFEVKKQQTSILAAKILEELPVADLNIEEPPIEEIIRDLFTKKNYQ